MARRNPADAAALDPALTQKKRARRRLVGALVLGIAAAIVLPLVLDSEPRQTITDVEIEIPPREAALPAVESAAHPEVAVPPATASPVDDVLVPPPHDPMAAAKSDPKPAADPSKESAKAEVRPDAPGASKPDAKTGGRAAAEPRSASKVAPAKASADSKSASRGDDSAKPPSAVKPAPAASSKPAPASPVANADSTAPAGTRFALQIGAFANAGSARAQLDKARRTGLRAYTETVDTTQGERTRVRVGPFPTREAAEKARATLKLSGIDSAVVDAR
jgi:DedD protein